MGIVSGICQEIGPAETIDNQIGSNGQKVYDEQMERDLNKAHFALSSRGIQTRIIPGSRLAQKPHDVRRTASYFIPFATAVSAPAHQRIHVEKVAAIGRPSPRIFP